MSRSAPSFAIVALVVVMTTGCSMLTVQGPRRDRWPGAPLQCTTSYVAPMIDTVLTAGVIALGAGVASLIMNRPCGDDDAVACGFGTALFVGLWLPVPLAGTALATASAGRGYGTVSACRDAKASAQSGGGR